MTTFAKRLARAAEAELSIDPRKLLAYLASTALPHPAFQRTRTGLLRTLGVRVGSRSAFLGPVHVTGPGALELLSIGDDTSVTGHLHVDLGAPVSIGNGVRIGHNVTLLTLDHEFGAPAQRCGAMVAGPIIIEDGVWLASRVTVLPGITIGRGAIVGAGAVVTQDVAPDTLVGGVPARVVRDLVQDSPSSARRRLEIHQR